MDTEPDTEPTILFDSDDQSLEVEKHKGSKKKYYVLQLMGEKIKVVMFETKARAKIPLMPILHYDVVIQDRENKELLTWIIDSNNDIWVNFAGSDKLECVTQDYMLWLLEDPYKETKEKLKLLKTNN